MSDKYECPPEVLDARLIMCQPQDNNALKWLSSLLIVLVDQQDDQDQDGIVFTINGHQMRFTYEGEAEEEEPEED